MLSPTRSPLLPSTHLPAYLRRDLQVGVDTVHPLAAAVDDLVYNHSKVSLSEAFRLFPSHLAPKLCRHILEGLGFVCSVLSEEAISRLFVLHPSLFARRGTLDGIRALAKFYFGDCRVTRGRPQRAEPLSPSGETSLVLSDTASGQTTLFVRLLSHVSQEYIDAFVKSVACLLNLGMQVEVGKPCVSFPPLPKGQPLNGRLTARKL